MRKIANEIDFWLTFIKFLSESGNLYHSYTPYTFHITSVLYFMFKLLTNCSKILSFNNCFKTLITVPSCHKSMASKAKSQDIAVSQTNGKTSGMVYDPSKSDYNPVSDAIWKAGERVPYLAFATTLKIIEETSGRLKMIEILSNYFRSVIALSKDDLIKSIYLCVNKVGPDYEGLELGISDD